MNTEIQKTNKGEITLNDVQEKIITIQNKKVLLDSSVALLYGVDTNDVNQAVRRNPEKFPEGYIIGLTESEKKEVATICGNPKIKFSPTLPNAFTEKGLYMLATILKSEKAKLGGKVLARTSARPLTVSDNPNDPQLRQAAEMLAASGESPKVSCKIKWENEYSMKTKVIPNFKIILIGVILLLLLCCVSCNRKSSSRFLSQDEEKSLIALGQLWGFLKYHHPAVANGEYNWDMELINLIPQVLATENDSLWKNLLDDWIDRLPAVTENPEKKLPDLEIKTKPDYGELFNTEYFYPETIDKIRYILDNAEISYNHYVSVDMKRIGQISITNELSYNELLYPELSYRLLALFRYWNIVNYFFPYRELCDQKWSTVLADMLPEFVNAENQEEYIFACLKLVTKIDDSHGFFSPNLTAGLLGVPFEVQFIEDCLVVTKFTGNDANVKEKIKTGDIIIAIDGEPVEDIVKRMLPYTPASNYPVKLRQISYKILSGNSEYVRIIVQRDGKSFKVKIPRYDFRLLNNTSNPQPDKDGYSVLDNNIGYVLPSNCKVEEREKGIEKVLDRTKGVIIDMRCYPNDFVVSSFLPHLNLLEKDRFFPEIFSNASVIFPGYFFAQKRISPAIVAKKNYSQKVVVIVNENTQSQAEELVMYFQTASNVIVIGSTTAGADGWIVNFNLPGNIRTSITGIGEYYPDGGETQRVGIRIDEIVKPTISGIKSGRDELLERAIEIILL